MSGDASRDARAHRLAAERHQKVADEHKLAADLLDPQPPTSPPPLVDRDERRAAAQATFRAGLVQAVVAAADQVQHAERIRAAGRDPMFDDRRIERLRERLREAEAALNAHDRANDGTA